jgi:hypothetical protein
VLVTIVIAPNADNTGPDLDRLGKVEDIPDEVARPMLDLGTARKPTEEELAAYHGAAQGDAERYDNGGDLPPGLFTRAATGSILLHGDDTEDAQ